MEESITEWMDCFDKCGTPYKPLPHMIKAYMTCNWSIMFTILTIIIDCVKETQVHCIFLACAVSSDFI